MLKLKPIQNEKGSMTIEFLMVVPYYLLFFLFLWQAVASGITILQAQSAVNEAAKVYSVTENRSEAQSIASDAIGSSDIMKFLGFEIYNTSSNGNFEAEVKVRHGLVFIPREWRDKASIDFSYSVNSRVIK